MLSNLSKGTAIGNNNWLVDNIIGQGSCAQIYNVKYVNKPNPPIDYELVIKVIPLPASSLSKSKSKALKDQERICNTLYYEYTMYVGLLSGFPYCPRIPPKCYGNDETNKVRYLVMEKLGEDLISLSKKFISLSQICDIGLQLLKGLEWIHNKNFLLIDIKPANFMIKEDRLYFVDCEYI